ncbi:MAG: ATP-binding protein [Clostridia bacterium]
MTNVPIIFYILQATISVSIYIFFAVKTFENHLKHSKKVTMLISVIYICFSVAIIELFFEITAPFGNYRWLACAVWIGVTIILARFGFSSNPLQLIFYIFAVFDIELNVVLISRAILNFKKFPLIAENEDLSFLVLSVVILIAILPLIWNMLILRFKVVVDMQIGEIHWKSLFFLPLTYFLFCILNSPHAVPAPGLTPLYTLAILIILNIFSYLSYTAVLEMLFKTHDSLKANEKAELSKQMIMLQKEQYQELVNSIEKEAKLRHDFRHHLIAIEAYATNSDLEGLNSYLAQFKNDEISINISPVCNNHFIDIILRHFIAKAKSENIEVKINATTLGEFNIPNTELCVVFGNLFENALESCERQKEGKKFIKLTTKNVSSSMLAVTVTNSYDGDICFSSESDTFYSKKHPSSGIGTKAIRSVAEKNGGSCTFTYKNGVFKSCVLLVSD